MTANLEQVWWGQLDSGSADLLREMAWRVVDRLGDPDRVLAHAQLAAAQSPHQHGWHGASLAQGDAGVSLSQAVVAAALDGHEGQCAGDRATTSLRAAVASTQEDPLVSSSLCNGTAGLMLAVDACTEIEPRFSPARDKLLADLVTQVGAEVPLRSQPTWSDVDWDFMSGSAGTLAYLTSLPEDRLAIANPAISALVDNLRWVGGYDTVGPRAWRWMINRSTALPGVVDDENFPSNYLNLALSHGLAGIMGTLANAMLRSGRDDGLGELVQQQAEWLVRYAAADAYGPLWPPGLTVADDGRESVHQDPSTQLAWCYGAAGIGLALHNAGAALGRDDLIATAAGTLRGVRERILATPIEQMTLCHGTAGLVLLLAEIELRLPRTSSSSEPSGSSAVGLVSGWVVDAADEALPLLYRDLERGVTAVDQPGMLNGAAGVALALASLTTPQRPAWLRTWLMVPDPVAAA